jgi:integrase/recombinase XerC
MRQPQPYYKQSHRAWYANIGPNKNSVRLASEEDGEQAAWDKYHDLMAGRQPLTDNSTVGSVLDRFAGHCQRNLAAGTYAIRKPILESFARFVGPLRLSALKVHHVTEWIEQTYPKAGPTYRHNLIRTIKTAFKWAEDEEHIVASPLRKVKLPRPRSRDVYLMPDQFDKLLALVAESRDGGCLSDILVALKESGCRPVEARRAEARHFDRAEHCWIFPVNEAKMELEPRVVLLTPNVYAITERLALKYPEGPMFRNSDGTPWTRFTLGTRLRRLSKKLGFHVCAYAVRHTFATDAIIRGVDLQTIATLMGHVDLKMLSRIYQHIRKRSDFLRAGLNKAVGI